MSLRFLCTLAVLEIFGLNFNVFAEEHRCEAVSVKDTCADKVADLKQPKKLMAQLLWYFGGVEFKPHENTKKVLLGQMPKELPKEIEKTKPKKDPNYIPLPVEFGYLVLTCANDRDVFPNTCSGYRDIEIFTAKKALRQAQSEQMVHERALGDVDDLDLFDYLKKLREQEAQEYKDKGFNSTIFEMGMAYYFFSEYDEGDQRDQGCDERRLLHWRRCWPLREGLRNQRHRLLWHAGDITTSRWPTKSRLPYLLQYTLHFLNSRQRLVVVAVVAVARGSLSPLWWWCFCSLVPEVSCMSARRRLTQLTAHEKLSWVKLLQSSCQCQPMSSYQNLGLAGTHCVLE